MNGKKNLIIIYMKFNLINHKSSNDKEMMPAGRIHVGGSNARKVG
mgnify:CR=1 FL=1